MASVVRDQGCELAVKQPVQQALALAGDIVFATEQRAVADATLDALRDQRLLLEQAIDQGLDRGLAPILLSRCGTTENTTLCLPARDKPE